MPPREIPQGDKLDEHGLSTQGADDGIHVPALVVEREHFVSKLFEIRDLRLEFCLRILADAGAAGKHDGGGQCGDPFQRGDDLPDFVTFAHGAVPAADEQVTGEQPALFGRVETEVVGAVPGRVKRLEAEVLRFDPGLV